MCEKTNLSHSVSVELTRESVVFLICLLRLEAVLAANYICLCRMSVGLNWRGGWSVGCIFVKRAFGTASLFTYESLLPCNELRRVAMTTAMDGTVWRKLCRVIN